MGAQIVFIDIETVPQTKESVKFLGDLFEKKFNKELLESSDTFPSNKQEAHELIWKEKASFYAEFGKIVCVGIGILKDDKTSCNHNHFQE
jgi:hypothetical protein